MITKSDYLKAKVIVEQYERDEYEQGMRQAEEDLLDDDIEPCSVCGEVDGMNNPCCASYDPLSYKACGYG